MRARFASPARSSGETPFSRAASAPGRRVRSFIVLPVLLALVLVPRAGASQDVLNRNAAAALGQPTVVLNGLNQVGATGLFYPHDVARDTSASATRLYVADTFNSRVLGFDCGSPACDLVTGDAPDEVWGQPGFETFAENGGIGGAVTASTLSFPRGVAVSPTGRLVVADTGNNRVLVYDGPWTDTVADVVLGQSGMTTRTAGSGTAQLNAPEGVFVDSGGAIWVADTGNNRVIRFSTVANGASSDLTIGVGGAPSSTTLSTPRDLILDGSGRLWVADAGFSRVLVYPTPLTSGKAATIVFGHAGSFTSGAANDGGLGAASLAYPEKIHLDPAGRLWVADTANNRVLRFDTPLSSQTASAVYGQASRTQVPTFTTNGMDAPDGFPNAAGLWGPRGMEFDADGQLWLCDRDNSRLLAFENPLGAAPASIVADRLLGKPDFTAPFANQPTARRFNNPVSIALDRSVSPGRLWVADIGNSRVLGFSSGEAFVTNQAAERVLGQPDFVSGATNAGINGALQNAVTAVASASSLFFPEGVATDSSGSVYVADASNSRVLKFLDPYTTDTTADTVFGQADFTARNPSYPYGTATSLAGPRGVGTDGSGGLWVADTLDHRVVRFPVAGGAATVVLGQSGFVSSTTFPPYTSGCSATRMNQPEKVHAGAGGRLYVADTGNHRVLVFQSPYSSGMAASAVLGQANLTSCSANRGGAASASTLKSPEGVFEDADGNVHVADAGNNRVLVYRTPFSGGDLVADQVLGQPDFATTSVVAPGAVTLSAPSDVARDGTGALLVCDRENSRVTRYVPAGTPFVQLEPIVAPIVVGQTATLTGSGFTAGSVVKLFVATSTGPVAYGPYVPATVSPSILTVDVPATVALGNGLGSVVIVNTDQGYVESGPQSQLLYGYPPANLPTITAVNGVPLRPADPSVPAANVETLVTAGSTATLSGTGFDGPLVNLYTASGNVGPLAPLAGESSTQIQVTVPGGTPTGPGSFQAVNDPYTGNVQSNAVSVPIGALVTITSVQQNGTTVTVNGTGFCSLTVINLFNDQGDDVVNLGGLNPDGSPKIPLDVVSPTQFTFQRPAGAAAGPAYVQAINPPFITYSSSGDDPDGAFAIP